MRGDALSVSSDILKLGARFIFLPAHNVKMQSTAASATTQGHGDGDTIEAIIALFSSLVSISSMMKLDSGKRRKSSYHQR